MDRVETMRIAVGAADRLVGALEAGSWPDDRTPGGTFLAALVDYAAGPPGPDHPFARQGVVRALGECRDHIEGRVDNAPQRTPTPIRERAAWAHSVFYERMDGVPVPANETPPAPETDVVGELQRLVEDHPQAVAVPPSSAAVLQECMRWALYWRGSTAHHDGHLREAEQWFRVAIDAGHLAARNDLAVVLDELGRSRAAKALWTRAAQDGDADAACNLGTFYERAGDLAESETWFRAATELGHLDASVRLGQRLHQRGETAEAERLWRRAAEAGIGDAHENLGALLLERDDVEGAHLWLEKSAAQGHAGCCRQLAALYERLGRREKTIEWLQAAADNGHPSAAEDLERLTNYDPFLTGDAGNGGELLLSTPGPLAGRAADEFIAAARETGRRKGK